MTTVTPTLIFERLGTFALQVLFGVLCGSAMLGAFVLGWVVMGAVLSKVF